MFALTSLPKTPAPKDSEQREAIRIEIAPPKSEPNLPSSFVFPNTGSKDIDRPRPNRPEGSL